ncbi:MAG: BlaI/MecI/CopY family transcriptional regulator [Caulobacterales bacterium]
MSISGAESRIMEALWRRSPLTAEEIVAEVAGPQRWSEATVKSLINRLLTKGAIEAEKAGRRYLYRPQVDRGAYVSQESRGLLDRLFDGRIAPLVSHFSKTNQLSSEDVAELKRLIAELDDDR